MAAGGGVAGDDIPPGAEGCGEGPTLVGKTGGCAGITPAGGTAPTGAAGGLG
jgi:hypothetical protein